MVYNDLSLAEIAQENGISRQGVHDLKRRCDRLLQEYEDKLHLVERFMRIRDQIKELGELTRQTEMTREELQAAVTALSNQILEEL